MRNPTRHVWLAIRPLFVALSLLFLLGPQSIAQSTDDRWQEVMRGEGFIVEVDTLSLTLKPVRVIGATYRMKYLKSGSVNGIKFRSMIAKYEFDRDNYRIIETRYFDSDDSEISTLGSSVPQKWIPRTPTASRFVRAAGILPPFGTWKVTGYRYGNGSEPKPDENTELSRLKDSFVVIDFLVGAKAGKTSCNNPSFELRNMDDDEVKKRLSIRLGVLGIAGDEVRTLLIECNPNTPTSLMFLTSHEKAILLWDGMFLSIEREKRKGFTLPTITIK